MMQSIHHQLTSEHSQAFPWRLDLAINPLAIFFPSFSFVEDALRWLKRTPWTHHWLHYSSDLLEEYGLQFDRVEDGLTIWAQTTQWEESQDPMLCHKISQHLANRANGNTPQGISLLHRYIITMVLPCNDQRNLWINQINLIWSLTEFSSGNINSLITFHEQMSMIRVVFTSYDRKRFNNYFILFRCFQFNWRFFLISVVTNNYSCRWLYTWHGFHSLACCFTISIAITR